VESDVAKISIFCDFKNFSEIERKQLNSLRRCRHVVVVIVAAQRVFDDDVARDLFDLVEAAFD
jgi:hypothetical protein